MSKTIGAISDDDVNEMQRLQTQSRIQELETVRSEYQRRQNEQALVYYEDPSFKSIVTEQGMNAARKWRYGLERRFGMYNADLAHTCTRRCFDSELGVEVIDQKLGIHGCVRSGRIHQCALEMLHKKVATGRRTDTCTIHMQGNDGAVLCRFSGWVVDVADALYNPYTDDHIEFNQPFRTSTRVADTIRSARTIHDERARLQAKKEDSERGAFSSPNMKSTTRALRNMLLRSSSSSAKRPRETSSGSSDDDDGRDDQSPPRKRPTTPPVPPPTAVKFTLGSASGRSRHIADIYYAKIDVYNHISRVIKEILFDGSVRSDFEDACAGNHDIPWQLGSEDGKASSVSIEFYSNRIALLYALFIAEEERSASAAAAQIQTAAQRRGGRRPKRNTRALKGTGKVEIKKFAVATLYMLCGGIAIGDTSVLAQDANIHHAMPREVDIVWYGMTSERRRAYLKVKRMPAPHQIKYKYDRAINQRLQRALNKFDRGPELLSRLLSGDMS